MNSLWKRYGLFGLLTALAVGLDQWTKRLAVENLMGNGPFVIWDGVFELLYSENRGAAFGILHCPPQTQMVMEPEWRLWLGEIMHRRMVFAGRHRKAC